MMWGCGTVYLGDICRVKSHGNHPDVPPGSPRPTEAVLCATRPAIITSFALPHADLAGRPHPGVYQGPALWRAGAIFC
jgi:hypothetical protein